MDKSDKSKQELLEEERDRADAFAFHLQQYALNAPAGRNVGRKVSPQTISTKKLPGVNKQ